MRDWNQQDSKISIWLFKHLDFSVNKEVLTKPCRITDWDSGDWQDAAAVLTSRRDGCRVTAPSGVFVSRAESNSLRFNIDLTRRGMRRQTDESEPDRLPSLLLSCLHRWHEEGEKKREEILKKKKKNPTFVSSVRCCYFDGNKAAVMPLWVFGISI